MLRLQIETNQGIQMFASQEIYFLRFWQVIFLQKMKQNMLKMKWKDIRGSRIAPLYDVRKLAYHSPWHDGF
jgi:hypothetical protein